MARKKNNIDKTELKLKELYKVINPFTAVGSHLAKKHGYSFVAFTMNITKAKIEIDEALSVEQDEILLVVEKRLQSTRDKSDLPLYYQSKDTTEYTFLNGEGKTIETLDPNVELSPDLFFEEFSTKKKKRRTGKGKHYDKKNYNQTSK